VEYDIDEGWMRVEVRNGRGQVLHENGRKLTRTLRGTVEARFREPSFTTKTPRYQPAEPDHQAHIDRAEAKRQRKAEKARALHG
jgi:hypothetical protein